MTLLFMNTRTLCFTLNQGIILSLTDIDIISYRLSAYLILGDSLFDYNIQPYEFIVRYSTLLGTAILDSVGVPIPLDEHNIINKYMVYCNNSIGNNKQALFILNDSIEYSLLLDWFRFQAVPMIGVILKYSNSGPTRTVNDTKIPVPRPIYYSSSANPEEYAFDSPIWNNLANTLDNRLTNIYGTIATNILTNNNEYSVDMWNSADTLKRYWIDITKATNVMKCDNIGYSSSLPSAPTVLSMINDNFYSWDNYIKGMLGIDNFDIGANINDDTHRVNGYFTNTGLFKYGERVCVDYIPDSSGVNFNNLISQLTNYGIFNYISGSTPYILTSSADPGDINTGQHVIGVYPDRPDWLDSSNQYYYRNPINNEVPRKFNILYWKYGIRYYNFYANPDGGPITYTGKAISRRCKYIIDTHFPYGISTMIDSGWAILLQTDTSQAVNGFPSIYILNILRIAYPLVVPYNWTGSILDLPSDDFIKYYHDSSFDKVKTACILNTGASTYVFSYQNDNTIPAGRLSDKMYSNVPLTINTIVFKKDALINVINAFKQLLLMMNMSILLKNGMTYDSGKRPGYQRRMHMDNLANIPLDYFYNLDDNSYLVQQYKYMQYIKYDADSILNKYDLLLIPAPLKQSLTIFYNNIFKNYKHKVRITFKLITDIINISSSRYFIWKGRRYICTSYAADNATNTTIILAYGG